jgi:Fic family protein
MGRKSRSKRQNQPCWNLRHSAIITSSIASCAIENIHAPHFEERAAEPLRSLTREERELANYKKALEFVYDAQEITIEPGFLRTLHQLIMADALDAGEYKRRNNQITEILPDGRQRVRFTPVAANQVEDAIDQLCLHYNAALKHQDSPPLLTIAALTLDFTAIHPFPDGNGRTSRVLTAAALISEGYQLPKYISLEEIIDQRSDDYYRALLLSSEGGWHQGNHNLELFLRFHTQVIVTGYQELQIRRERSMDPITVILHNKLPEHIVSLVWKQFKTFYPQATLELTSEGIKTTQIKGLRSGMSNKKEWENLTHADRLIRNLVHRAKTNRPITGSR